MSLIIRNLNIALHFIFFLMVSRNIIFASGQNIVKILEMEWIKGVNLDSYVILVAIGLCESMYQHFFSQHILT
jgi:hypothetical protein